MRVPHSPSLGCITRILGGIVRKWGVNDMYVYGGRDNQQEIAATGISTMQISYSRNKLVE